MIRICKLAVLFVHSEVSTLLAVRVLAAAAAADDRKRSVELLAWVHKKQQVHAVLCQLQI